MTEKYLRSDGDRPGLAPDQRAVFDAYYEEDGVVCTPAGSGTGKTTTAIEVVAEAVVRELHRRPGQNPFESILVTTFTKDAARQLKTELKDRLRAHRRAAPDDDPVVAHWEKILRWLETASHVRTIDSFTQDLLREIALEAGIAPSFGVADGIRRSDLIEDVFADLRANPDLEAPIARLEDAFPPEENADGWDDMVVELHRRCREFCTPIPEARRQLLQSVTEMHDGREPDAFENLVDVGDALTDYPRNFVAEAFDDPEAWVEHAMETYRTSRRLAGDLGVVLDAFDERYDEESRSRGVLTHTDITYVVREYLEGDRYGPADPDDARRERVRDSLAGRFEHVVVDEFQDTNFAQCRILSHLLGDANALLIGDLKQSIYEWRSAEPRLFADLIDYAHGRADGIPASEASGKTSRERPDGSEIDGNVLDADRVVPVPLAENFRSHPHLVGAANHVFPRIFSDPGRGGIGTFDVEYDRLTAERAETEPDDAHIHVLELDDPDRDEGQSRREALVEAEAERVAGTLRTVLEDDPLYVDRDLETIVREDDDLDREHDARDYEDALEPVRAGDVAILFRTKTYMRLYSRVLDRYGVDNAVIGTHSLYREPEIEALIDALAWVGDPGAERLRPVVESGIAALGPEAQDRLEAAGYDLDRAIREGGSDEEARENAATRQLERLVTLREELRYDRTRPKAEIVSTLLAHSAFDVAALADREGLQRYANLRRFAEVIDGWEDEETLSYGEFMRRLQRLRDGRVDDDQTIAAVADMDSADTVKLLTAHTAKGLEFPVVVLADTARNEAYQKVCDERFLADRRHGIALQPRTGTSEQPDGGSVPTFDGDWFHEDDSGYEFDRGLLWVSEIRGTDGRIRHEHPMTDYVRDARAEFWRLLYVAVTRAGDHLILPLGSPRGNEAKWNTWAVALAEYLNPGDDGVLETADGDPRVPIGVDDLTVADPPTGRTVDLADLLDRATGAGDDAPTGFAPRTVAATGVADLLGDPPGYQRRVLRGMAPATGVDPGEPPDAGGVESIGRVLSVDRIAGGGSRPPGDLPPTDWGDAVHATLEGLHRVEDPGTIGTGGGETVAAIADRAATRLGDHPDADAVRQKLVEEVVPAYRDTDAWDRIASADERLPEFPVVAPLSGTGSDGSRRTYVRGRIDLLTRTRGDWRITDFKTGTPPDPGSAAAEAVRTQVSAYAWLLEAIYGIEVGSATLLYLHPEVAEVDVDVDPRAFGESLTDAIGNLVIDGSGTMRRR